jgi:hypothetical protein
MLKNWHISNFIVLNLLFFVFDLCAISITSWNIILLGKIWWNFQFYFVKFRKSLLWNFANFWYEISQNFVQQNFVSTLLCSPEDLMFLILLNFVAIRSGLS